MKWRNYIFCDWRVNKGNLKSRVLLVLLRTTSITLRHPVSRVFALPVWFLYKFYSELVLKIELSPRTSIGPGLHLPHPQCIVINRATRIGTGCTIRHGVTIGVKAAGEVDCPVIGDEVEMGCGVVILGPVQIGDRAVLGANVVVVKNVEPASIAFGQPMRLKEQASAREGECPGKRTEG